MDFDGLHEDTTLMSQNADYGGKFVKRRDIWVAVLATAFGFLGGSASRIQSAAAADDVLRASRIELVDAAGKLRALLNVDGGTRQVSLSFLGTDGKTLASFGLLSDRLPTLDLNGADGKARAVLHLTDRDRPVLGMGDDRWEGRILLGAIEGDLSADITDWGLQFTAPGVTPLASIGSIRDPKSQTLSGTLVVRNSIGKAFRMP